jgi:DNA-3-methyladenine glycosylase II
MPDVELPGADLAASFSRYGRHGDDLMERFDGRTLVRPLRRGGEVRLVAATIVPGGLEIAASDGLGASTAASSTRAAVVEPGTAFLDLAARDPVIGRLAALHPGFRPVLDTDPLASLVRAVSAQQINLGFAAMVRRRLAERYGRWLEADGHGAYVLDASALASADPADVRALQFTQRKAETIVALAQAVVVGTLALHRLADAEDETIVGELTALRGIGRWTAEWFLARDLGRPCVVAGDLGVRKAVGLAYAGGRMPSEEETRELTAHWGGAATAAQALLLHALASGDLASI